MGAHLPQGLWQLSHDSMCSPAGALQGCQGCQGQAAEHGLCYVHWASKKLWQRSAAGHGCSASACR